eukprot:TRINITY_DN3683_c3_g1_i1.p1 TRINITY_DN3683_c3_g1~~TRINITY_DN3683_c3_g1_i1.p1  ORF type:complete len:684 (+),score=141.01 TRINITY_DN3683_c3_g1_i1:37-2088(+)
MSSNVTSRASVFGIGMEDHSESEPSNLDVVDNTDEFYQYMLPNEKKASTPPPPPPPPPPEDESEVSDKHIGTGDGTLRGVVRVEDWLLDVGVGYSEHLRKLQADKIKEELQGMQDRPVISDLAKKLTRGGVPVEERLMDVHYKRQRRAEQRATAAAAEASKLDPECTHKPDLNPDSHYKTARYAMVDNQAKIQKRRERLIAEEMKHVRDPVISEKSAKLAENRTQGMRVQDYLLHMDAKYKQKMFERHELEASKGIQASPNITKRAKSLKRSGDIGTRLYDQRVGGPSDLQRLENANVSASRSDRGILLAFQDRGVNESYTPKINPDRHGLAEKRKHTRIENRLYSEYHTILAAKERELHRIEEKLQREASTIHTSKHSDTIYKSSKRAKSPLFSARSRKVKTAHESEPQPKPSKKISAAEFNQRLASWEEQKQKTDRTRSKLIAEKLHSEMAECTFDPFRSSSIRKHRHRTTTNQITEGTLQDRSSTWTARRESKLNQAKESTAAAELDGCTFTPYINQEIPDMSARGDTAYGYNEFVNRLRRARTDKETEKQRIKEVFPSGDGWNGQQTIPKGPKLGGGGGGNIKSLAKPLEQFNLHDQLHASPDSQCNRVLFSGFDIVSNDDVDHEPPYQSANGIAPHSNPAAPLWTTGHADGESHREGSVDDFLSQHSNVMAMVPKRSG